MDRDAHYRAETAERIADPFRAALAYLVLGLGVTGTLAIIPSVAAMLAARGFH